MYKMVVMDLDGTLLTSKKKISKYTCDVIKLIKKDVKIVLASARAFTTIEPYLKKLKLLDKDSYTIAFNGSLVTNNLEEKIIDASFDFEEKNILQNYIENNSNVEWFYYTYEERIKNTNIKNTTSFLANNNIYKIVCISDIKTIEKMRSSLPQNIIENFQITSSETNRIEFVKKGMTKVSAIKVLQDILNIDTNDIIAIGDGENDIDMIKYAGIGIAMGNSSDLVKDNSNLQTDSNDNDGVGKALQKLFNAQIPKKRFIIK